MRVAQHVYARAMFLMMMVAAPQHQVVKTGGPSRARHQMVGLTPGSGNLAARPAAAAVAYEQCPILVVARKPHHVAKIEDA